MKLNKEIILLIKQKVTKHNKILHKIKQKKIQQMIKM